MMTRRKLFAGGLLAGLAGSAVHPREVQAADDQSDSALNSLRSVLEEIRKDLRGQMSCTPSICPEVDLVRQEQRRFLKASGKFPDFIDIGIDLWERLCDWHVKNLQPQTVSRMGDGRYAMTFGVTTLVLRPEMSANYMGLGYDAR